jgi:hypothetical protein
MNSEYLLHYIWKHSIFSSYNFRTTDDQDVSIIQPGFAHHDAGPDFKQAIIKINQILWAGDVEIHIRTSDWFKHNHHLDEKYNSVILHVVYEDDLPNVKETTYKFPILELKSYISESLLKNYEIIRQSTQILPCAPFIKMKKEENNNYLKLLFSSLFSKMIAERLEYKQSQINKIYTECSGDWDETIFRLLAINFGFHTNQTAFELMTKSLPYKVLRNHSNNHLQVYALLFGQSGLLEDQMDDPYYVKLQNEYQYLKKKYRLIPIHVKNWNLLRMRPQNFPCIRIAQLCEIVHHYPQLFHRIETQTEVAQFEHIFMNQPDPYWSSHYQFGKSAKPHGILIGRATFELLMINTIIPVLYSYGIFSGNSEIQERAVDLYSIIEPENNHLITQYKESGFPIKSAFDTQSIIHLSKNYCNSKKCLDCPLGQKIISGE